MGRGHGLGLSVYLYVLSDCDVACLLGGLGLVVLLVQLIVQKTSPTRQLVSVVIMSCREVYRLVRGFLTHYAFFVPFFYVSTTFTTDPRVVMLVAGSAPVEHPHKHGQDV